MLFFIKLLVTNAVIIGCVLVGKRFPALAGLIATMPITSLLVLAWLYSEDPGNLKQIQQYTGGVFWGILPTLLFFAVAFLCLRRQTPLSTTLLFSFAVWLAGAAVHQWLLR